MHAHTLPHMNSAIIITMHPSSHAYPITMQMTGGDLSLLTVSALCVSYRPARGVLRSYGRIECVHVYGNPATFSYASPGVRAGWEAAGQAARAEELAETTTLRCEVCGNYFPSVEKLQKHFKMLHERQFNKMKAHK